MTTKADMDFTYTTIDKLFRLSMGETGDFSAALYEGDTSLPLEDAQRKKYEFVLSCTGMQPGARVLDIGSGWGGFLKFLKQRGMAGTGITLSDGQMASCRKNGLDAHMIDYRDLTPEHFGTFDLVTNLGVFAHFCTIDEWRAGKQEENYTRFFQIVRDVLKPGGRLFVETTVFGKNMIPYECFDINAPKESTEYLLALGERNWTDGWLPYGDRQLINLAAPYFKLISKVNGRLDYIRTISEWHKRYRKFGVRKYLAYLSLLPQVLLHKDMYYRVIGMKYQPHSTLMQREVFDHFRLAFQSREGAVAAV